MASGGREVRRGVRALGPVHRAFIVSQRSVSKRLVELTSVRAVDPWVETPVMPTPLGMTESLPICCHSPQDCPCRHENVGVGGFFGGVLSVCRWFTGPALSITQALSRRRLRAWTLI